MRDCTSFIANAPGISGRVVRSPVTLRHILLLAFILVGGACSKGLPTDPGNGIGRTIQRVAGEGQTGPAGQQLAAPLAVRVTRTSDGAPEAGIPVVFSVTSGGGTLSSASVATDAGGTAQVLWTLGPTAGAGIHRAQANLSGATGSPISFTATAQPAAASQLVVDGPSNGQRAGPNAILPVPITVVARDPAGNGVPGVAISWQVSQGGGTVSPLTGVSDAMGRVSTTWTLGATGTQALQASSTGLPAATASATIVDIAITGFSIDTLAASARVTIMGRGFGTSTVGTQLQLDGMPTPLVSVTPTSVIFDVPTLCRPLGAIGVRVMADGATSAIVTRTFRPAPTPAVPLGSLTLLRDPAAFCVQFAETSADEAYLVGVLNAAESPLDLRNIALTVRSAAPVAPRAAWEVPSRQLVSSLRAAAGALEPAVLPQTRRFQRHGAAERQLRLHDASATRGLRPPQALMRPLGSRAPFGAAALAAVSSEATVGDTIPIRYAFGGCTTTATISTVVRDVGRRSVWLEDLSNPAGGFSAAEYRQLSTTFDSQIFTVDSSNWGNPTDLDNNSRIAIVVTRRVNDVGGILGFVTSADFLSPTGTQACPRSNFGEVYYAIAPDPNNPNAALRYSRADALADAPLLLAHEFTHIIQFGRRAAAAQPFMELWEAEGGATLSEQLNGFAADGLAAGGNYGLREAFSAFDATRIAWYADTFTDVAQQYGFACASRDASGACVSFTKVSGVPQECAFLATFSTPTYAAMGAPCLGGRTAYGTPSLLLRYVADQYGPTYAGGSTRLLSDLVGSGAAGLANVTDRIGVPADRLLAEFWATLYLDDRVSGTDSRLQLATWNLTQIFEGTTTDAAGATRSLRPETRLVPAERAFGAFTDQLSVRGGSSSLMRLAGIGRPGTALQVTAADGLTVAPSTVRLWIVRIR